MEAALKTVKATWKMHWLEGADHSFHVLKSSGRTDAEVLVEVANAAEAWMSKNPAYADHDYGFDAVLIVPRRWPDHLVDGLRS